MNELEQLKADNARLTAQIELMNVALANATQREQWVVTTGGTTNKAMEESQKAALEIEQLKADYARLTADYRNLRESYSLQVNDNARLAAKLVVFEHEV